MSHKQGLLVVGSVALDTIETAQSSRHEILGGSAAYFAAAASFFGPVSLVAVVGDDFPAEHTTLLTSLGVGTEGLERRPGRTFRWHGRYSKDFNQRTSLDTQLNVFAGFEPKLPPAARRAQLLFLGNIDPALQLRVLEQMDGPALVGLDTMNFWINGSREALLKVLLRVDFLLLNDEEARLLSGIYNLVRAARAIQGLAGHASSKTTERYMHLAPQVLESAIRLLDGPPARRSRGTGAGTERFQEVGKS